jgi:hypothetical protein
MFRSQVLGWAIKRRVSHAMFGWVIEDH